MEAVESGINNLLMVVFHHYCACMHLKWFKWKALSLVPRYYNFCQRWHDIVFLNIILITATGCEVFQETEGELGTGNYGSRMPRKKCPFLPILSVLSLSVSSLSPPSLPLTNLA